MHVGKQHKVVFQNGFDVVLFRFLVVLTAAGAPTNVLSRSFHHYNLLGFPGVNHMKAPVFFAASRVWPVALKQRLKSGGRAQNETE